MLKQVTHGLISQKEPNATPFANGNRMTGYKTKASKIWYL